LVFEVNKSVTFGFTLFVQSNFARKDITKGRKGIVEFFVANCGCQVLDEYISHTSLSDARITLGPHNPAWLTTKGVIVEGVQCPFSIDYTVKIYIGVTQGPTSERIATDTDRSKGAHRVEDIAEHAFVDL